MGGYLIIGQACGSVIFSHWRYDFNRQSRSHCGSSFLWEMKRTISSLSPGGAESASMSVTKPHLYSRFASVSISVSAVGISIVQSALSRKRQNYAVKLEPQPQ